MPSVRLAALTPAGLVIADRHTHANLMVEAFAARLKGAMDLDMVRADLASVVNQALVPAHLSVWTRTDLQVCSRPPAVLPPGGIMTI